jgi:hypothetical protein
MRTTAMKDALLFGEGSLYPALIRVFTSSNQAFAVRNRGVDLIRVDRCRRRGSLPRLAGR